MSSLRRWIADRDAREWGILALAALICGLFITQVEAPAPWPDNAWSNAIPCGSAQEIEMYGIDDGTVESQQDNQAISLRCTAHFLAVWIPVALSLSLAAVFGFMCARELLFERRSAKRGQSSQL